jgi:ethanolamine transporter
MGFTAGFAPEVLPAMIISKLVGGISAVVVALWLTKKEAL